MQLAKSAALPSFTSDFQIKHNGDVKNRVSIPIEDEIVNPRFYCHIHRKNKRALSPLIKKFVWCLYSIAISNTYQFTVYYFTFSVFDIVPPTYLFHLIWLFEGFSYAFALHISSVSLLSISFAALSVSARCFVRTLIIKAVYVHFFSVLRYSKFFLPQNPIRKMFFSIQS